MRTGYSYIRMSSDRQRDGDSEERQAENIEALCERYNLVLDDSISFKDLGKSAFSGDEQASLDNFIALAKAGKIKPNSVLLVDTLSRFSRKRPRLATEKFLSILNAGHSIAHYAPKAKLYDTNDDDDYSQITDAARGFERTHGESAEKSGFIVKAWKNRRKESKPYSLGNTPAWLTITDGKFAPIPEHVKTVKLIYKLTLEGYSQTKLAAYLNNTKVPLITRKRKGSQTRWTSSYIAKIVTTRQIIGECVFYNKDGVKTGENKTYYPAVIDLETFNKVQALKRANKPTIKSRDKKHINLFTGLLSDAEGNKFYAHNKTDRRILTNHDKAAEQSIKSVTWDYVEVEKAFINFCKEIPEETFSVSVEAPSNLEALKHQMQTVLAKSTKLEELLAKDDVSLTKLEIYGNQLEATKLRIVELSKEISAEEDKHIPRDIKELKALADVKTQEQLAKLKQNLPRFVERMTMRVASISAMSRVCLLTIYFNNSAKRNVIILKRHKKPTLAATLIVYDGLEQLSDAALVGYARKNCIWAI